MNIILGLQTDFTSIKAYPDLIILLAVCLIATFGKIFGAGVPAYCLGIPFRESMVIAGIRYFIRIYLLSIIHYTLNNIYLIITNVLIMF